MNPLRGVAAVIAGIALFRLLVAVLETTLVGAMANAPVTNEAEYFAVRNRPGMLAAAIGYNAVAAFLAGYTTARIAGVREVLHASVGAAALIVTLFFDRFTPGSARIVLAVVLGPTMMAGAWIRAKASREESPIV
jgi:hypothetical protein